MNLTPQSFAEYLRVLFALSPGGAPNFDPSKSEDEIRKPSRQGLADYIGVSVAALDTWLNGKYKPQRAEFVEKIANYFGLTVLQTDQLLYLANPNWVKYQTPIELLERFEIVRYRQAEAHQEGVPRSHPNIPKIEQNWRTVFEDTFVGNHNHWGLGTKDDGLCMVERRIADGHYLLTLTNRYVGFSMMGGDSHCFAPSTYYLTATVTKLRGGTDDDGFGLIFEEVSDGSFAILRVRDEFQSAAVVSTRVGVDDFEVHIDRTKLSSIRPWKSNKLGILAMDDQHWFFVNNTPLNEGKPVIIPRIPHSRLDVGVIAQSYEPVICQFDNFKVRVPRQSSETV